MHQAEAVVTRRDLYLLALIHPLEPITSDQLAWEIEEGGALEGFQPEVSAASRAHLLAASGLAEAEAIADLWQACLERLDLSWYRLHPEELVELTPEHLEAMVNDLRAEGEGEGADYLIRRRIARLVRDQIKALLARVGQDLSLSGLLRLLTGHDLLDEIRPYLVPRLANFLDQGLAAWHGARRDQGFYADWRALAPVNPTWHLLGLAEGAQELADLPAEALEAIIQELERLRLPQERWAGYLQRLALELPGWGGLLLWRQHHAGYQGWEQPVTLHDYLAVRLVLDRLFAQRLCLETWGGVAPDLSALGAYLARHPAEFLVRWSLFNGRLPEYLASRAQRLLQSQEVRGQAVRHESGVTLQTPASQPSPARGEGLGESSDRATEAPRGREGSEQMQSWEQLAQLIWAWRWSPTAEGLGRNLERVWPLFLMAQHLGLPGAALRQLGEDQVQALFACLDRLDEETAAFIWLRAYENHYRDRIFNALLANQGRGRWTNHPHRPRAQLVFCMDDREEGIRRHLEEVDTGVETLGAAAHFGVPHWWQGLDDATATALCPVVMVPAHAIQEQARPGQERRLARHRRRLGWRRRWQDLLHQELRRHLFRSALGLSLAAPAAALTLAAKVLVPGRFGHWLGRLRHGLSLPVATELRPTLEAYQGQAAPDNVQPGFTTQEQAQRLASLLRVMGLTADLAPLVVIMGHGSDSDNNPHLAAYNCGACSGNHSGPNARLFATLANRPQTREHLRQAGIQIPEDSWFLGAEHNTCNEDITWYDLDALPAARRPEFQRLQTSLREALHRHAQERCRKFVSAPLHATPAQALAQVRRRGLDFSQARPELGHATNACAFVGRRAMSQGVFFDRRAFLISYDATQDADGALLEPLLLANGPVGAGINLEYYFSTVDNDRYGAGSKVTHNVAGFFGVMDGTSSDLRTGLPRQMIEIHEPMRLLLIVEAKTEVLTAIYQRQPALRELIGNGWLLLAAKDPYVPAIHYFAPDQGWVPWSGPRHPLPRVERSSAWFTGRREPLDPVFIGD